MTSFESQMTSLLNRLSAVIHNICSAKAVLYLMLEPSMLIQLNLIFFSWSSKLMSDLFGCFISVVDLMGRSLFSGAKVISNVFQVSDISCSRIYKVIFHSPYLVFLPETLMVCDVFLVWTLVALSVCFICCDCVVLAWPLYWTMCAGRNNF